MIYPGNHYKDDDGSENSSGFAKQCIFGTLALIRGGSEVKTAPLGNTGSWRVDGAVSGKARVCKKVSLWVSRPEYGVYQFS